VAALGETLATGIPGLTHVAPSADRVAGAGSSCLAELGVPQCTAETILAVARGIAEGTLRLQVGNDVTATRRELVEIGGIDERIATMIVMRGLCWPDAFPAADRVLQRAAGASSERLLRTEAEKWRPWRGYAACHLWLHDEESGGGTD